MNKFEKQLFAETTGYDDGSYCDFNATVAQVTAGKDILVGIWNNDGSKILAVAGQQSLDLQRSAESSEVITKDSDGSWSSAVSGNKSWTLSFGGLMVVDDESLKLMDDAFENGDNICVKIYNKKKKKSLYGGLALITDFSLSAPHDDSFTYSLSLKGVGKLTNFSTNTLTTDTLPTV